MAAMRARLAQALAAHSLLAAAALGSLGTVCIPVAVEEAQAWQVWLTSLGGGRRAWTGGFVGVRLMDRHGRRPIDPMKQDF